MFPYYKIFYSIINGDERNGGGANLFYACVNPASSCGFPRLKLNLWNDPHWLLPTATTARPPRPLPPPPPHPYRCACLSQNKQKICVYMFLCMALFVSTKEFNACTLLNAFGTVVIPYFCAGCAGVQPNVESWIVRQRH